MVVTTLGMLRRTVRGEALLVGTVCHSKREAIRQAEGQGGQSLQPHEPPEVGWGVTITKRRKETRICLGYTNRAGGRIGAVLFSRPHPKTPASSTGPSPVHVLFCVSPSVVAPLALATGCCRQFLGTCGGCLKSELWPKTKLWPTITQNRLIRNGDPWAHLQMH